MIKTTSVAKDIRRYIASTVVIIPPPFQKAIANPKKIIEKTNALDDLEIYTSSSAFFILE